MPPNFREKTTEDTWYIRPEHIINEFLKDPSGSIDLNINGLTTPTEFSYIVPDYKNAPAWIISGLVFVISDGAIVLATKFAGRTPLANGLQLKLSEPKGLISRTLLDIKTNLDFALFTNEGSLGVDLNTEGTGPDSFSAFVSSPPGGYRLLCRPGTKLSVVVRDDLSSVIRFNVVSHGFVKVD